MSDYARPDIPTQVFHDAAGAVIDYGNRWTDRPGRMPPEHLYSVVTHPERFAPLHAVAEALIDHLRESYDVQVTDDPAAAEDLMHPHDDVVRALRLTPANRDAASLTFVFTAFPGVLVHAGLLHDYPFPECGCDACDDSVDRTADEMERIVFAVVEGRFRESVWEDVSGPFSLKVGHELRDRDHPHWRSGWSASLPSPRITAARQELQQLPNGWQPWTRPAS